MGDWLDDLFEDYGAPDPVPPVCFTPPSTNVDIRGQIGAEPRGPALARLECADGTLIEGRALSYHIESERGIARVVLTFLAETTTPEWKREHAAGEDMGAPINPDDPALAPEAYHEPATPAPAQRPINPKWGEFA